MELSKRNILINSLAEEMVSSNILCYKTIFWHCHLEACRQGYVSCHKLMYFTMLQNPCSAAAPSRDLHKYIELGARAFRKDRASFLFNGMAVERR